MATIDRMRVVEMRNFVPYPILDLMDGVSYTHIKGQFTPNRPTKNRAAISGARRFDGDRIAFEKMGNASLTAQWFVRSGNSQDQAVANVERLGQIFEDATAQGRLIEVRLAGTTRSVFYEPRGTPDWSLLNYDPQQFIANGVLQAQATIPVAPLAFGAPMDIADRFETDTIANGDWSADAGGLQTIGTSLAPNGLGSYRYRRTIGYPYQDAEIRMQFTTGATTLTNGRWGVFMSGATDGSANYLGVELDQAQAKVQLVTVIAGTRTVIQSYLLTPVAGILYEMRVIRIGDTIQTLVINLNATAGAVPTANFNDYTPNSFHTAFVLAGSQLGFQQGDVGIYGNSVDATERIENFAVRPFTYFNVGTPEQIPMRGKIPGSAPAAVDLEVTTNDAGAIGQAPIWALWQWSERPLVCNLLTMGDFETSSAGWNRLALTNYITNAATSITQGTGASRYGSGEATIVTPASTQSGVSFNIYRRMKANRQYAAWCWVKSAAGTTSVAAKVGGSLLSGSAIGTAKALSTAWQLLAVTYRPTADSDWMVFAVTTQAATATTFEVDGCVVVEVPTLTLAAAIGTATATTMTVYNTPPETPYLRPDGTLAQPFLFLIDSELIRCTAITGNVWTIERGAEFTTAATHAVDSIVAFAPTSQPGLEGKGAEPTFGVIEGENIAPDLTQITSGSGTLGVISDTAGRGQQVLSYDATSAGVALAYWYLDPNAIAPDEFTLGEIDVEVFARIQLNAGSTATLLGQVEPTERNGLVLAGRKRYTREYGAVAKTLVLPSSSFRYRLVKIGTFPMIVDRTNPQRWRLRLLETLSSTNGLRVDYLLIHPVRYRACPPTGKQDDGGVTYPNFIPPDPNWGATNYAMTKIFRADGSALIRNPIPSTNRNVSLPPAFPDHGLGKQIQFPVGAVDLGFKLSDTIPDDPTVNTAADMSGGASASWQCTLRAMIWPRYYVGRGGY